MGAVVVATTTIEHISGSVLAVFVGSLILERIFKGGPK